MPYPSGETRDATVVVVIVVNADGSVRSTTATSPDAPFSTLAEERARTWRFRPATRGGAAIAARIRFEIVFHAPAAAPATSGALAPLAPPTGVPGATGTPRASAVAPGSAAPAAAPPPSSDEVRVRGARAEPSRTATLSRAEVRQIPGTFGDPFRAIEIMPGVTPIVSGLPFFFVRGAPPGDVGYFLDGVRVPYLFHVGAGPSVVHPGIVQSVDLYPGGYPARFGRFSGGIVAGETVAPAKEAHGEYNVRLFDAGALLEVPFADGRGTALVGGRYSYTGAVLTLFSPDTVLSYWDYQARASYALTPRDRVSVFSFGAYDYLGQKDAAGNTLTVFGTEFHRVDLRYDHALGGAAAYDDRGTMRTATTLGLDRTQLPDGRFVRDRLVGARNEIAYPVSPHATARAGTDVQLDAYDIVLGTGDLSPSAQRVANTFPSRDDLVLGTRADVVLDAGRLEIVPGARFDFFASQGATAVSLDPRLATRARLTDRVRLLSAMGTAHQAPAFVIPVPGFEPGGLKGGLQNSVQESAGVEVEIAQGTTATATLFHNAFYNLSDALSVNQPQVAGCPPGSFPGDTLAGDPETQPTGNGRTCMPRFTAGTIGPDRSGGGGQGADSTGGQRQAAAFEARARGNAYGLELFVKKKLTSKLGGFLSYTLSRSTRSANGQSFIASFDRTHVLNTALAYDLGRNWRAGTRLTFYTGLPKAQDPTDPSSTRLAPFFRVDLRLEKRWQLGKKWWISVVAEWMNATLSKESIGTMCTLQGCQETKIGPVTIPSLGVEGGF